MRGDPASAWIRSERRRLTGPEFTQAALLIHSPGLTFEVTLDDGQLLGRYTAAPGPGVRLLLDTHWTVKAVALTAAPSPRAQKGDRPD